MAPHPTRTRGQRRAFSLSRALTRTHTDNGRSKLETEPPGMCACPSPFSPPSAPTPPLYGQHPPDPLLARRVQQSAGRRESQTTRRTRPRSSRPLPASPRPSRAASPSAQTNAQTRKRRTSPCSVSLSVSLSRVTDTDPPIRPRAATLPCRGGNGSSASSCASQAPQRALPSRSSSASPCSPSSLANLPCVDRTRVPPSSLARLD